jgi:hypothetical protein
MSRSGQSYSDDMTIESEVNFHGHTRDVFVGWLDSDHAPKIVIVESGEHDHWAKVVERCHPDITPIDNLVGSGSRVHCLILMALRVSLIEQPVEPSVAHSPYVIDFRRWAHSELVLGRYFRQSSLISIDDVRYGTLAVLRPRWVSGLRPKAIEEDIGNSGGPPQIAVCFCVLQSSERSCDERHEIVDVDVGAN